MDPKKLSSGFLPGVFCWLGLWYGRGVLFFFIFFFFFFFGDRKRKYEEGFHRNVRGIVLGKRNTLLKDHRRRERVDYRGSGTILQATILIFFSLPGGLSLGRRLQKVFIAA